MSGDYRKGIRLFFRLPLLLWVILIAACASTADRSPSGSGNPGSSDVEAGAVAVEPTVVAYDDYRDPLIRVNRVVFAFNDVSFRYALIPLSKTYLKVPEPVRQGISNFFHNIKAPIYLVNNALQLKPGAAGTNLSRFGINTTLGLLGLFDPAKHWFGIEKAEADFADTLAHYGAGYGIYLVLPLLGPSDLRNGTSSLTEHFLHPLNYLTDNPDTLIIQSFDHFQTFAPEAEAYQTLTEESNDPYIYIRNMYLQGVQRDAEYQQP